MSKTPEQLEQEIKDAQAVLAKNAELLEENRKLKAAKADEELAKKKLEEEKLLSEKKYQELAELRAADAKAANDKLTQYEQATIREKKIGSLSLELDKLGIIAERKAAILGTANLDSIQFLDATKTILGADQEAKRIQSVLPELFGKKTNNLPENQNGNGGAPEAMTVAWFNSLSKEEQAKQYGAFLAANGLKVRR